MSSIGDIFPEGFLRASLNIRRAEAREKIFRQMKQDSARVAEPTRRNFVKYDEKESVEISCDDFIEMPLKVLGVFSPKIVSWPTSSLANRFTVNMILAQFVRDAR